MASESVADILERELPAVIQNWLSRVEEESDLTYIPLTFEERTGHLPRLLHEVIARLRLTQAQEPLSRWPLPIMEICGTSKDTQ